MMNMDNMTSISPRLQSKKIDFSKLNTIAATQITRTPSKPLVTIAKYGRKSGQLRFNVGAVSQINQYSFVTLKALPDFSVLAFEFHKHRLSEDDFKLTFSKEGRGAAISAMSLTGQIRENSDWINIEAFRYQFEFHQNGTAINQFYIELSNPFNKTKYREAQ